MRFNHVGALLLDFGSQVKIDISEAYKKARIDLIRTHDAFGAGDIDAKFDTSKTFSVSIPSGRDALNIFPDMGADADNPKSYNFGQTSQAGPQLRLQSALPAPGIEFVKIALQ